MKTNFWTDSGPHYKNYACLGSLGMHVPNRYETDAGVFYGPASHWKGFCDAKFGGMNGVMKEAVTRTDITTIAEYHAVLKDFYLIYKFYNE